MGGPDVGGGGVKELAFYEYGGWNLEPFMRFSVTEEDTVRGTVYKLYLARTLEKKTEEVSCEVPPTIAEELVKFIEECSKSDDE